MWTVVTTVCTCVVLFLAASCITAPDAASGKLGVHGIGSLWNGCTASDACAYALMNEWSAPHLREAIGVYRVGESCA